ncbi:alpha/beta fold hydrolase [Bordetella sp. 15P40C-2]|uniref:alpha/beta fold hydrolase n=1 Tax=Bordetella sp. 15P40C-2 TaxID=2572246 RepID=UPI001327F0F7|nr:alpha/beta hydrolase [Bordetella sp. 15P40C-2]MVW71522.1 alpha/beta fold hydrolase [Bordetella sp. 15P40C-2]
MERRDYFLTHAGLKFHVTEWGCRNGRPILMLHGIRGYAETFAGIAAALQPEYRVIAYDQRGRGQSDWDPEAQYFTDVYVADLEAIADQLSLAHFDLLGHSMGGINAIAFAARHPQRVDRLIIEDAGPGAFEHSEGARRICRELLATPSYFPTWEAASEYMRLLRPTVGEQARQQRLKAMLKRAPDGGHTWKYDHTGIARTRLNPDPKRSVDLEELASLITCPTLVVRGGRSDYLHSDMVAKMQNLNARFHAVVIADAGHYVHDDQPQLFAAEVVKFLSCNHELPARECD